MDAGTARPVNLWYSRGNPGGANGCPDFPRARRTARPNYGAHARAALPVRHRAGRDDHGRPGLPLRRRDAPTRRSPGPSTGTAAGSCTTTAATASSTALLLDPETDQDGGQPIYADSLRGVAQLAGATTWTRSSARTARSTSRSTTGSSDAGPNAGLYRFDLHGRRPDTPGADPQWEATGNPLEVQFSNGASGGVSWEWDFDNDGTVDSTEADPLAHLRGGRPARGHADSHLRRRRRPTRRRSRSTRRATTPRRRRPPRSSTARTRSRATAVPSR